MHIIGYVLLVGGLILGAWALFGIWRKPSKKAALDWGPAPLAQAWGRADRPGSRTIPVADAAVLSGKTPRATLIGEPAQVLIGSRGIVTLGEWYGPKAAGPGGRPVLRRVTSIGGKLARLEPTGEDQARGAQVFVLSADEVLGTFKLVDGPEESGAPVWAIDDLDGEQRVSVPPSAASEVRRVARTGIRPPAPGDERETAVEVKRGRIA